MTEMNEQKLIFLELTQTFMYNFIDLIFHAAMLRVHHFVSYGEGKPKEEKPW